MIGLHKTPSAVLADVCKRGDLLSESGGSSTGDFFVTDVTARCSVDISHREVSLSPYTSELRRRRCSDVPIFLGKYERVLQFRDTRVQDSHSQLNRRGTNGRGFSVTTIVGESAV
jgi:hypothetical protein